MFKRPEAKAAVLEAAATALIRGVEGDATALGTFLDLAEGMVCSERPIVLEPTTMLVRGLYMSEDSLQARESLLALGILRYVDILSRAGQEPESTRSIAAICDSMNLPEEVSDVRHKIVHKEMPSLSTLSMCAGLALDHSIATFWCHKANPSQWSAQTSQHRKHSFQLNLKNAIAAIRAVAGRRKNLSQRDDCKENVDVGSRENAEPDEVTIDDSTVDPHQWADAFFNSYLLHDSVKDPFWAYWFESGRSLISGAVFSIGQCLKQVPLPDDMSRAFVTEVLAAFSPRPHPTDMSFIPARIFVSLLLAQLPRLSVQKIITTACEVACALSAHPDGLNNAALHAAQSLLDWLIAISEDPNEVSLPLTLSGIAIMASSTPAAFLVISGKSEQPVGRQSMEEGVIEAACNWLRITEDVRQCCFQVLETNADVICRTLTHLISNDPRIVGRKKCNSQFAFATACLTAESMISSTQTIVKRLQHRAAAGGEL